MAGLLDGYPGLSAGGNIDLNQLVRPPDPLGAALGEISQRLAVAGQASRLPVSTLGALGSALGGASTAAQTAQTQYLDQAIKLQALKRSLMAMGYDEKFAELVALGKARQLGGVGTAGTATAGPGAPAAAPALASGAGGSDAYYGEPSVQPAALSGPGPLKTTGLLGDGGGAGAATTPASFRLASLVGSAGAGDGAGDGSGAGADPASLAGLLAPDRDSSAADPLAGLLATNAPIQPGGSDTLVRDESRSPLPVEQASMSAPRSKENIVSAESGGNPNVGYGGVDLSNAPRDPETGFPQWAGRQGPAGISHAAGKYQFQPATWAEGARALGINDFSEKSQDAVYDWIRAKYGDAPWQASEGGGARPGMMLAQYAPGSGAAAVPDAAAVINGLMQQRATTSGGGLIPGLGLTPAEVAMANAYGALAGRGAPFKEFLDMYYKDPAYLQDAARAGQLGKSQVDLQFQPLTAGLTAGAQAAAQQPYELQKIFAKSQADLINDWDKPQQVPYIAPNGESRVITASPRMLAGGRPPEAVFGPAAGAGAGAGNGAATSGKGGGLLAPSAAAPAAGTVPPGGLLTGLAPGAVEEQKGQGQQLSAFVTKVHGDAETARTQAPDLEMLARVGPNIDWAGPGAPYKQIFNRATASAFGVNTENVASYEMAQQLMGGMLRKALRASDSNPTEKQQQMMLATFPTPESSKQGFAQGVGYMQGIGDWQVFREEALRNWTQTHNNSADGFQEKFKISAIPFVVQQMPQATRDAYFAQLKAADPSGNALHRLADQMQAVKQGNYNYSY